MCECVSKFCRFVIIYFVRGIHSTLRVYCTERSTFVFNSILDNLGTSEFTRNVTGRMNYSLEKPISGGRFNRTKRQDVQYRKIFEQEQSNPRSFG